MIRIQITPLGTLFVTSVDGQSEYTSPGELDPVVKEKYYLLMAADPGSHIPDVGRRVSEDKLWIYNGDDRFLPPTTLSFILLRTLLKNDIQGASNGSGIDGGSSSNVPPYIGESWWTAISDSNRG